MFRIFLASTLLLSGTLQPDTGSPLDLGAMYAKKHWKVRMTAKS